MIQKDTVGDYFKCSKLSTLEVLAATGVGLIIFFLASIPTLIRQFHLTQAQTLLLDKTGNWVGKALSALDSFSFTNTLVTFLFWGVVGIFIYGISASLVKVWQAGEEEKELASDDYVHPEGFSKKKFWKQIIEKEAFSVAVLIAELIVMSAAIFWALPFGVARVEALFGGFALTQLLFLLLGAAIISALFCLGLAILKAWRYRHILFVV